jgi:hypothetical protein
MMINYYEVGVTCTGSSNGEEPFRMFDDFIKIFDTVDEVRQWINKRYRDVKHQYSYVDIKGVSTKCGYVFQFDNADWSHAPVEHWIQADWVNINKIYAENAFKEVDDEILEINPM